MIVRQLPNGKQHVDLIAQCALCSKTITIRNVPKTYRSKFIDALALELQPHYEEIHGRLAPQ